MLLQLLRSHGTPDRSALRFASGLSASAVTNVINELLSEGLVEDLGRDLNVVSRTGRPSSLIGLASRSRGVLSVQIGFGSLQVAVCDLSAKVLASKSSQFAVPETSERVLDLAEQCLRGVLARSGLRPDSLLGLGVGVAGLVDSDQRVNLLSHNLGWENVAIADHFESAFGVPTVVDHNVRAMAVGEFRYGLGRGLESLAFLYARSGVGAGLVLGGRAYRGGTHGATQIGHLQVVPDGLPCTCGARGCLETVVSDEVLSRQVTAAAVLDPAGALRRALDAGSSPVDALVAGLRAGDAVAESIRDAIAEHVATVLVTLVNLLNPQLIVLGGLLAEIGEYLVRPCLAIVKERAFPLLRDSVHLEVTRLGAQAGVIGAASLALDAFLFGEPLTPAISEVQWSGR